MGCQSWGGMAGCQLRAEKAGYVYIGGGMAGLSIMGRYGWTVSHGEVQTGCQSWGGMDGLLIKSRKDVDMPFIVEGVDVLSTD